MIRRLLSVLALVVAVFAQPATAADFDLDLLQSWYVGDFSTAPERDRDSTVDLLDRHVVRIAASRTDGRWFYVEHVHPDSTAAPVLRYLTRIRRVEDRVIEQVDFLLPPTAETSGWTSDPAKLDDLPSRSDLSTRRGCEYYHRVGPDLFTGRTMGMACGPTIAGASYSIRSIGIMAHMTSLVVRNYGVDNVVIEAPQANRTTLFHRQAARAAATE